MVVIRLLKILWASPYTLLGLSIGLMGMCAGGRLVRKWPLEFCDGGVAWFLRRMTGDFAMAMTLGHVILGLTESALDVAREHEFVHVRQYERWGPFFGPAYFGYYAYLKLRGRDGYRENPFEKEAFGE